MLPSGLALARDGTLYISDEAGQRIRALRNGIVSTLAGSGSLGADGLSVKGGFQDGPALSARFDRPEGIAIGPDGAVYVADSSNACVRKIDRGVVSVVAGKPGQRGATDGDRATARLTDPRDLGFDRHGNLYIADYDAGLRELSPGGLLTTIKTKTIGERRLVGLAVIDDGGETTVVIASPLHLMVYHPDTGADEAINLGYAEGNRPFGFPARFGVLNDGALLFSDVRSSNVRFLRLPVPMFATTAFTNVVAGGAAERPIANYGDRDGSRGEARFDTPLGIATSGDLAFVADGGNRKIRVVRLPHFRLPEAGTRDVIPGDDRHYDLTTIGESMTFWDSMGDEDSICGRLESDTAAPPAFGHPLRCHAVRLDEALLPAMTQYVDNYLVDAKTDTVVLVLDGDTVRRLDPAKSIPDLATDLSAQIGALNVKLRANHIGFMVLWTYQGEDVSALEAYESRDYSTNDRAFPADGAPSDRDIIVPMVAALSKIGIAQLDTYDGFVARERSAEHVPLFGTEDQHMTASGNALVAELLARYLREHPVSGTAARP